MKILQNSWHTPTTAIKNFFLHNNIIYNLFICSNNLDVLRKFWKQNFLECIEKYGWLQRKKYKDIDNAGKDAQKEKNNVDNF